MTNRLRRIFIGTWAVGMLLGTAGTGVAGSSLYEYYTDTPTDTLKQETRDMGKKLSTVFGQNGLADSQQQIDFAEYYSNLRRMIVYATKMATYSDYEKDLNFARDHEVFKGLPDNIKPGEMDGPQLEKKEFVKNKYKSLSGNIGEEIDTYKDLIYLSLDACETLAGNDLSEFVESNKHQGKVGRFIQSKDVKAYESGKRLFAARWPKLAARIAKQLSVWREKPLSPNTSLIDPAIIEAL